MSAEVRVARAEDLPHLPAIERQATRLFPAGLLPSGAVEHTVPEDVLRAALAQRCLWVAARAQGDVVGFLVARALQEDLHIVEMDVLPSHGGQGLGRRLLQAAIAHAGATGHRRITLTTFVHVPWNAPFYQRAGFRVLPPAECGPALQALLDGELRAGLRERVAMCRDVVIARSR